MARQRRKVLISALLEDDEVNYLDRKIDKDSDDKRSRSALLRFLVRKSMQGNTL